MITPPHLRSDAVHSSAGRLRIAHRKIDLLDLWDACTLNWVSTTQSVLWLTAGASTYTAAHHDRDMAVHSKPWMTTTPLGLCRFDRVAVLYRRSTDITQSVRCKWTTGRSHRKLRSLRTGTAFSEKGRGICRGSSPLGYSYWQLLGSIGCESN